MTPFVQDTDFTLYVGDVREVLATMPDESVQCVVTSPPYWGLRDYQTEGQLGLEPTPELYVENMVAVFRDVRRVLRRDGTLWLNIGDSYASQPAGNSDETFAAKQASNAGSTIRRERSTIAPGLKQKDLCGIPWRLAFALQADGWYLRSDIVWCKPNCMPESVTDRPTKATEMVFLLTKSANYYYDMESTRETAYAAGGTNGTNTSAGQGRNARNWWVIPTQPFAEAHFATYPQALVERCVKAGTSERGACPVCGAPWERETERGEELEQRPSWSGEANAYGVRGGNHKGRTGNWGAEVRSVGWKPSCSCVTTSSVVTDAARSGTSRTAQSETTNTSVLSAPRGTTPDPVPCVVLDPFLGSGTTALVTRRLGRRSVGIELNPEYADMAAKRLSQLSLLA